MSPEDFRLTLISIGALAFLWAIAAPVSLALVLALLGSKEPGQEKLDLRKCLEWFMTPPYIWKENSHDKAEKSWLCEADSPFARYCTSDQ